VEKSGPKFLVASVIIKLPPRYIIGENSPNLVTLTTTQTSSGFFFVCVLSPEKNFSLSLQIRFFSAGTIFYVVVKQGDRIRL
jgi:hypothetical protein